MDSMFLTPTTLSIESASAGSAVMWMLRAGCSIEVLIICIDLCSLQPMGSINPLYACMPHVLLPV